MPDLFDEFLALPLASLEGDLYSAKSINSYPGVRVAKGRNEKPVIIVSTVPSDTATSSVSYQYKNFEYIPKCTCSIISGGTKINLGNVSQIACTALEPHIREYFLRALSGIISTFGNPPTESKVRDGLHRLSEAFSFLSLPAKSSIQGIWSELYIISKSTDPDLAIKLWHSDPNDIFDFSSDSQDIEVKSTTKDTRQHYFSTDQTNNTTNAYCISIPIEEDENGWNIYDLIESIIIKHQVSQIMVIKLNDVVTFSLGRDWNNCRRTKYSLKTMQMPIKVFSFSQIPRFTFPLPTGILSARYLADLENTQAIKAIPSAPGNELLSCLCKDLL